MESTKRVKLPNYTNDETCVLLSLVQKYYSGVINNKKTNAVTPAGKNAVWEKVAQEFNAQSPNNVFRPLVSIKSFYKNQVEHIRKSASEEKQQHYKTEGGIKPPSKIDNSQEMILSLVNKRTIFGLNNKFDSDQVQKHIEVSEMNSEDLSEDEYDSNEIFDIRLNSTENPTTLYATPIEETYMVNCMDFSVNPVGIHQVRKIVQLQFSVSRLQL